MEQRGSERKGPGREAFKATSSMSLLTLDSHRILGKALDNKESACNVGQLGSIPGSGSSPGEGHGNPLQYSCLENPMDRSLAGYSPWGWKDHDTTEQLTQHGEG